MKAVAKAIRKNPNVSQRALARIPGTHLSKVRRIMKEDLELKTYRTVKAQKLKESNQKKRLAACECWQEKMASGALNPKNIFFTDEKMFTFGADATKSAQNSRVHVHKSLRKEDVPADFLVRGHGSQQGGLRCMVSAGASYRGKGTMRIVEPGTKINAEVYLELTKNTYEPDMIRIFRPDDEDGYPNYYFQQDNAPAHTAGVVAKHLVDNVPNVLTPWPPSSPDLNVMDYAIWGMMDTAVGKKMEALSAKLGGTPPSLQQFIAAIHQVYDELDMAIAKKSVKGWKKRMAACVEKQGGHFEQAIRSK